MALGDYRNFYIFLGRSRALTVEFCSDENVYRRVMEVGIDYVFAQKMEDQT